MPLYRHNEFVERIPYKNEMIRRVYSGSKRLLYGLYDLFYWDRGKAYKPLEEELKKWYAWGRNRKLPGIISNESNFKDYFDKYKTHYDAWYKDHKYNTIMPTWQQSPLLQNVDCDMHEDLNLYAKWRQKRFRYWGKYQWTETIHHEGGGGGGGGGSGGSHWASDCPLSTGIHYEYYYSDCWAWVEARLKQNNGTMTGTGGSDGEKVSYMQKGFYLGWYKKSNSDLAHFAYIEEIGRYSNGGYHPKKEDGTQAEGWNYVWVTSDSSCGKGRPYDYIIKVNYSESGGGGGGGEEGWDEEVTYTKEKSGECSNQDNPTFPSPPKGKWIEKKRYTDERMFVYNEDGSGKWSDSWTQLSGTSSWKTTW